MMVVRKRKSKGSADIMIKAASTLCEELTVRADGICARATACALALNDTVKSAALEAAALQLDDDTVYYREFSFRVFAHWAVWTVAYSWQQPRLHIFSF